jgi:hypothetical protein
MFLAACGDASGDDTPASSTREHAKEAEVNLVKIRDASSEFWVKYGRPPVKVDELAEIGLDLESLSGEHYADIGYDFTKLTFDDEGKLTTGYFFAFSKTEADSVRLNGVTNEFDYVPKGAKFDSLKKDAEPANEPDVPANNG